MTSLPVQELIDRRNTSLHRASSTRANPPILLLLSLAWTVAIAGCASRRVTANPPVPSQPAPASPATIESSKSATAIGEAAPSPAPGGVNPSGNPPGAYIEEGNASWYGAPFNGRRASNGEIYDMDKFTAAHRTLPFGTMVRVTNLNNGKSTVVRITDRGPFVENRIIDLSRAAARQIESVGPGVVPVRVEVVTPGIDPTAGFFTVQVGAFRDRANADRLRDRLSAAYSPIFVQAFNSAGGTYYRVRVGKVSGEDAAKQLGEQLRQREGVTPIVVRLDEQQ
ncbi:MAG: septal ring lytic transglycosylase RlpA family protein [Candidatus Acidiferrum sp.]